MDDVPPQGLRLRKQPRQARADATFNAICEATIQILLTEGERRLTTTRVAERAGVSVGTLYQYVPHKQALLYAVLRRHLDKVAQVVEIACTTARGADISEMADALVGSYLDAKVERLDVTQALYLVAADLDTRTLIVRTLERNVAATAALLSTAAGVFEAPSTVALTIFSAIAGSTRVLFERGDVSASTIEDFRRDLTLMCRSYLSATMCRSDRPRRGG